MTATDFNDAKPQRSFDVIPAGTIATLKMTIRPGNAGEGGLLRRSKDGQSEALDCEFMVVDGPYANRKFWALLTLAGTGPNHAQAVEISRVRLRAILESARGVRPDDTSDAAKAARQVASYADFNHLRFIGRIGIEPAKDNFPAKNILLAGVTPDQRDWRPIEQVGSEPIAKAPTASSSKPEPAKIARPTWAG
jgi:hypothetical protein